MSDVCPLRNSLLIGLEPRHLLEVLFFTYRPFVYHLFKRYIITVGRAVVYASLKKSFSPKERYNDIKLAFKF